MEQQPGTLFIVSGPSGVGKTTLVTEYLKRYCDDYQVSRMVTYTTKAPRSTEIHGVDYHFIAQSDFERKVVDKFFLEWSGEYGSCYGTPMHILESLAAGQSFILVIDRVGAAQIIKKYPHAVLIWIQVSSVDVLSSRLQTRKTDSFEQIQTRLLLAKKEIEQESHAPMYHYYVVNDDLNAAVEGLSAIIGSRCVLAKKDIF